MKRTEILSMAVGLAALAGPAFAHHSGAMFDRSKEQTIVGTVKEFNWTNPHSSFAVVVTGPDGAEVLWDVEMNGPNNLVRQGWKRTTLKPGDKVSVILNPLRDGRAGGWYVGVTLPDGKALHTD